MAPVTTAPSQHTITAQEIIATALEAVSLAHTPLQISIPPYPSPPNHVQTPPHNAPLPQPQSQLASHVQQLLRSLAISLYDALIEPHAHLTQVLLALHPVALASSSLAHHLALLNVVPMLLIAAEPPLGQSLLCVNVMAGLLHDPLARARFAAADGPYYLLRLLQPVASDHPPSPIATPICTILADAFPHLPPRATDALRSTAAFETLRILLHHAVTAEHVDVIRPTLRLLAAIVNLHPTSMQPIAREQHLMQSAISAMHSMPDLTNPALHFLHAAIANNADNIALFGSIQSALGVDLVLRACRTTSLQPDFLTLLSEFVDTLACNPRNFRRMSLLGLTDTLIQLLPRLPPPALPSTMALLARSLGTPSAAIPYVEPAADALFHCLTVCSSHAKVQTAGIRALVTINETCTPPMPSPIPARSVQAAHFAMTEHAKNPRVLEACAHLFLTIPPAEIMASACSLPDLVTLLGARHRAHYADEAAADALHDAIQGLEFVIKKANITHGMAPDLDHTKLKSDPSKGPQSRFRKISLCTSVSGNLRKSWHKRGRAPVSRHSNNPTLEKSGRRTHSDFGMDYSSKDGCLKSGDEPTPIESKPSGLVRNIRALKRVGKIDLVTADYIRSKFKRRASNAPLPPCDPDAEMRVANAAALIMSEPLSQALTTKKEQELENSSCQISAPSGSLNPVSLNSRSFKETETCLPWAKASLNRSLSNLHIARDDDAEIMTELSRDVAFPTDVSPAKGDDESKEGSSSIEAGPSTASDVAPISMVTKLDNPGIEGLVITDPREYGPPSLDSYLPGMSDEDFDLEMSSGLSSDSESGSLNDAWASQGSLEQTFPFELVDDELYDADIRLSPEAGSTIEDEESKDTGEIKPIAVFESNEETSFLEASSSSSKENAEADPGYAFSEDELEPQSQSFPSFGNLSAGRHSIDNSEDMKSPAQNSLSSASVESEGPLSPSMDGDPCDVDLLVQSRRYGERERRPGNDGIRSSGSWNRPNWSIWSGGSGSEYSVEARTYSNVFHPRVETGSLRLLR